MKLYNPIRGCCVVYCLLLLSLTPRLVFSQETDALGGPEFAHVLPVADESYAKYCLAKYNREVEKAKGLIAENGSMTDFLYAQRRLRRQYFELDPDRMIYEQKFIDLWESFDIGQVSLYFAMSYTLRLLQESGLLPVPWTPT